MTIIKSVSSHAKQSSRQANNVIYTASASISKYTHTWKKNYVIGDEFSVRHFLILCSL